MTDKRKILIVEDEADFLFMLGPQAKLRGFDCEIDVSGGECVEKALKQKPGVILLDMNLPRKNGLSLIREIRETNLISGTPIIVISSNNKSELVYSAMNLGANAYFTKGGSLSELFEAIEEYYQEAS